jgi:hypothetical protein
MTRLVTQRPPPANGEVIVTRMPFARCKQCKRKLFFRPEYETAEQVLSRHSTREHLAPRPGQAGHDCP